MRLPLGGDAMRLPIAAGVGDGFASKLPLTSKDGELPQNDFCSLSRVAAPKVLRCASLVRLQVLPLDRLVHSKALALPHSC